jgi:hypothetical protein
MNFLTMGMLLVGYTIAYWGWDAMTDRVNVGNPGEIWWPSIKDLVIPANYGNVPSKGYAAGIQPTAQDATGGGDFTANSSGVNTILAGPGGSATVPTSSLTVA